MSPAEQAHFPRTALMLEATNIAAVFRQAAADLEELAGAPHVHEPGTHGGRSAP